LKTSKKVNDTVAVLRILKYFNLDPICEPGSGYKRTFSSECFIRMVGLLDRDMGLGRSDAAIPEKVRKSLRKLRCGLVESLYARIVKEFSKGGIQDEGRVKEYVGLVRMWNGLICLGRWVDGLHLGFGGLFRRQLGEWWLIDL
jgi:hypothetical protein